ncbi:MAG TPA: two-component regulator propeller domain-containing protein [Puia sp.]|nr:two-component regulator propeller domain-containing protein [Puia sp.]
MQNRISYITLLLFLTSATCVYSFAQQFNRYYNFKHLSVENGLADNIVYHFLQDHLGYMWLGTRNGITLYDGTRTLNFQHDDENKKTISGNFITRILEDSAYQVWVGTNAGLDLFNRASNSFIHFGITMSNGKQEDTYCVPLGFSRGNDLWFMDTKEKAIKVFNTRSKKFKTVLTTDAVDGSMYYNKKTNTIHIWTYLSIGTLHYIFREDSLIKKESFFNHEKNGAYPSLQIFHVFYSGDSSAWLSTGKGLIELNMINQKYYLYDKMNNEPVPESRYAAISPNGLLWMGTGGFGMYTFDLASKKFVEHFNNYLLDPFSICSNNIVSLYFDKTGNIWCGSYGNGVSYTNVEARFFSKYLLKNELDKWKKQNNVFWLGSDTKGNIWCLLQDVAGLWLLDSNMKIKNYLIPQYKDGKAFKGTIYQVFFDSASKAWLITDQGLFQYDPASNNINRIDYYKISNALFGSYWVNNMIRLHDHSLLFATFGGLYRMIKNNHGDLLIRPFSSLNNNIINGFEMIFEDSENNIYVKDIADSLFILSSTNGPGDYTVSKRASFHDRYIHFVEDDSNVYMSSAHGLYVIRKKKFIIEKSPMNNILPFTNLSNIVLKNNGIWISGDKGLFYYNKAEKKSRLFTVEDGLPSNHFTESGIVLTKSGKLITGTNNGLVAFDPEKINDSIYPPRAQLIRFSVNDSSTNFVANPQETNSISLNHDQNTFSIDFSCIGFQHIASCNYAYRLEGYDDHWIKNGAVQYTRYSKIPPGTYHFHLRVIDAKGDVSPYGKTLLIEIKKAFWQTTLFRSLIALLFIGVIWLLIKWYLSIKIQKHRREFEKQQAIEKERTRIATDMHDDLGAGLSSIRFLSEKVKRNTFSEVTKTDIDKILSSSSELIDKMNEIVWAMNEKNDSLDDLLTYVRSYAKEYCEDNNIVCEIKIPDNIPPVFVSGEMRRNVFLTIKESLHNIIKHAQASKAEIELKIDSKLYASIKDDGRGFTGKENKYYHSGNGLKNMRKRIESTGGSFTIYENNGTVVEFSVPLSV